MKMIKYNSCGEAPKQDTSLMIRYIATLENGSVHDFYEENDELALKVAKIYADVNESKLVELKISWLEN